MPLKNLADILAARRVVVGNSWGLSESELFSDRLDKSKSLYSRDLYGHFGCVNSIEFSPGDESLMVSGGDDKRVLLWRTADLVTKQSGPQPTVMKAEHDSNIFCLGFDRVVKKLFTSGNDHQVIIHDLTTNQPVDVYRDEEAIYGISNHPENEFLFCTAAEAGSLKLYDTRCSTEDETTIVSGKKAFHSVAFNPCDPVLLVSANAKEGVQLWDVRRPQRPVRRFGGPFCPQSAMSAKFDHTGCRVLALRRRCQPAVYDIRSPVATVQFDHEGFYNSCTMKSCSFAGLNDEYVMSGSDDFAVYLWKIPVGRDREQPTQTVKEAAMVLRGHRSIVNQVRFNRTNHMIVSSGVEKIIKLWSPWPMPECSGDTETVGVSSRDVYTHEEYITMVIRSGIALPHDNDTSTTEDVRMLAFFDSLVQRELEGFSDMSGDSDSSETELYTPFVRFRPRIQLSSVVVSSPSTSSDSDEENNASRPVVEVLEESPASPFSVAYRLGVANYGDSASEEESTESNEPSSSGIGYLLSSQRHPERNITELIRKKRNQLDRRQLERQQQSAAGEREKKRLRCSSEAPSTSATVTVAEPSDSDSSEAEGAQISTEEIQQRIRDATGVSRRQTILRRIRQRTQLDLSSDDDV